MQRVAEESDLPNALNARTKGGGQQTRHHLKKKIVPLQEKMPRIKCSGAP